MEVDRKPQSDDDCVCCRDKFEGDYGFRVSENFIAGLVSQPMRSVSTGPEKLEMIDPSAVARRVSVCVYLALCLNHCKEGLASCRSEKV